MLLWLMLSRTNVYIYYIMCIYIYIHTHIYKCVCVCVRIYIYNATDPKNLEHGSYFWFFTNLFIWLPHMLRKIKGQETTSLSQLLSDKYKENVDNFQQGILVSKYKGIMYR